MPAVIRKHTSQSGMAGKSRFRFHCTLNRRIVSRTPPKFQSHKILAGLWDFLWFRAEILMRHQSLSLRHLDRVFWSDHGQSFINDDYLSALHQIEDSTGPEPPSRKRKRKVTLKRPHGSNGMFLQIRGISMFTGCPFSIEREEEFKFVPTLVTGNRSTAPAMSRIYHFRSLIKRNKFDDIVFTICIFTIGQKSSNSIERKQSLRFANWTWEEP
jgi:hypothetical protein